MGEFIKLTPEQEQARKRRNLVIALSIAGFVALVFVITLAKLSGEGVTAMTQRPL